MPLPTRRLVATTVLFLAALSSAASAQERLRPGPWTREKIPDGWVVFNSKNYHVQCECGLEKAKRLADHMEAMNKTYRAMFKPDKGGEKLQTIKLFADESGFHRYGAPEGAAAYYSSSDREMVCYDTGKWMDDAPKVEAPAAPTTGPAPTPGSAEEAAAKRQRIREALERRLKREEDRWKMDLLGCAAHEGWHQYFHWYVGSAVELPSWVNEGMGDYFYTAVPKPKKGEKRVPAALGGVFEGRLSIAKMALERGRFVPASQLIRYDQRMYYSNPSICYAEGWSLCQFLLHGGNAKYQKIVPSFIRLVRDDTNIDVVTEKAFKGIDMAQLDKDFTAWVGAQKVEKDLEEGPIDPADLGLDEPEDAGGGEGGGEDTGGGGGR